MMTLKYPEPTVRPQEVLSQGAGLFTLPPQGAATISQTDAQALRTLCDALRERLLGRVVLTAHPHRIGSRTSVALHLEGSLGQSVDILVTVTGTTSWPQLEEYDHPRWYITVPDAADVVYLLLHLSDLCERFQVN